jgi:hypothetical protein
MAMVPNRPQAMARRVVGYSLAGDVAAALIVGLLISHVVGLIVLILGLAVSAFLYYNFSQVMKTRGYR